VTSYTSTKKSRAAVHERIFVKSCMRGLYSKRVLQHHRIDAACSKVPRNPQPATRNPQPATGDGVTITTLFGLTSMKKLLALSLVALAACQRGESPKTDSALAADLALASQMATSRPVPEFRDSAPQVASAPEPQPKAETPRRPVTRIETPARVRTIPRQQVVTQPVETSSQAPAQASQAAARGPQPGFGAGAAFSLASQQRICTSSNRPGDRFVATISNTIYGDAGATIPAGSNVVLEVASVTENGISFAVHSVELNGRNYSLNGDVYSAGELEKVRLNPESDAKKVAGGAAVGALIGQIMKKNTKGTVIGAAAGGAAGAVAAKMTAKYDSCLPVGAPMRLTLSSALMM
jgi:hypothetical protein